VRKTFAIAAVVALATTGCGASDADQARSAAQGYVKALGKRDGKDVCSHMTKGLQQRFASALTLANPGVTGDCTKLMQDALDSLPPDQLAQFGSASIDDVRVTGSTGSFTYALKTAKVQGKVAKEGGSWKVSCCVPGQDG
jgi:hypothetical protein